MDLIACEEKIDSYLFKYGFEHKPQTNKERLQKLKRVIEFEQVNLECCDFSRTQNKITAEEYIQLIEKYSVNAMEARGYMAELNSILKEMQKEEREARRDELKQKIKRFFGKK